MLIHYALCDPSYNTGSGNYWTWYAKTLPLELLQAFYRDVAVKHLPEDTFALADPRFWDNFSTKTAKYRNWTVLYRFFSGGKDQSNRPGRYIILTAWIKTEEVEDIDLSPIQINEVFRSVMKNAKTLPVPQPRLLTEEWKIEPKKPEPENADVYGLSGKGNGFSGKGSPFPVRPKMEDKPPQQPGGSQQQDGNRGKTSRLDIIGIALLSFLLGMGTGVCAGVALQYSHPILPLTGQVSPSDGR